MKADRAANDTKGRRAWARVLVAYLLAFGLALSVAAPAGAIDIPFDPTPVPGEDACNNLDAPIPASPHGFGSFVIDLDVDRAGRSSDPFASEHPASLESVYGTSPQWFTYDNGCTGQFMAGAGTALGNILLELGGILPNWSHALLHSVLTPGSWLIALEKPVLEATTATARGVWSPWLPVVVLLVAALILLRARAGRVAASTSAAAWALLVLGLSSWLINYPMESVHLVDDGVRGVTGLIATGFNDGKAVPADPKDLGDEAAVVAVDAQFDEIVRTTQYRTWVTGVFGTPDSQTAIDYGPEVFAATHFTWEEYATYRKDPDDAGAKIVEKKADAFKTYAEEIKESDPLAYEHFTGEHWSQRATTSLVNLVVLVVTCGFLLLAGLASLLAFALIRLIVPFAPVMGVLFMIDRTRDAAVAMLKRVIGPLVMGPVCFLVGLLLLRFFAAILSTESMWFVLQLGLIGVLTFLAWKLCRPQAYTVAPLLNRAFAPLRNALATRMGARAGAAAYQPEQQPAAPVAASSAGRAAIVFIPPPADTYSNPDAANFVPYTPPDLDRGAVPTTSSSVAATSAAAVVGGLSLVARRYPAPPVGHQVVLGPLGPGTRFDAAGLEPRTKYTVPGRGAFYTDDDGVLTYVETAYGDRSYPNPDLNHPAAGVTYVVEDHHAYVTDQRSRTVAADAPELERRHAHRSPSIQAAVGKQGGEGYDGGHLIGNAHGGGREKINIVAMLQELNRSGSTLYGSIPNSFYALETELREAVDDGSNVSLRLSVDYIDDTQVPKTITAHYSIDGVPDYERFDNVRE